MVNDSLGYIRLSSTLPRTLIMNFCRRSPPPTKRGYEGLIFDLRDNPGGLLQSALLIANEFLPAGDMIIYTEGKIIHVTKSTATAVEACKIYPPTCSSMNPQPPLPRLSRSIRTTIQGMANEWRSFSKGLVLLLNL